MFEKPHINPAGTRIGLIISIIRTVSPSDAMKVAMNPVINPMMEILIFDIVFSHF